MTPKRTWLALASLALLVFLLSGCDLLGTADQVSSPAQAEDSSASPQPPLDLGSGELAVRILSPHDGEIVESADVLVIGEARPGIVVSVNDGMAVADAQGRFAIPIHLEEGTNLLEVIASNEAGDQVSATLVVSYLPPA